MPPKQKKEANNRLRKADGILSVKLFPSPIKTKKYRAVFYEDGIEFRHTDFGAVKEDGKPYSDFTQNKDEERKERYIERHRENEDWGNPYSAGALSRWVLWNKETLRDSWNDYKYRFNFQ
jgi:hypothetical protein